MIFIISDISKSLGLEWVLYKLKNKFKINVILINCKETSFENWLKNNPGKVDIWIGGHTHTNPDDTKGGKSHIEKKYGETTFINVAALTRWHVKHHATPLSRILTFEESSEKLSIECFMHSDDYREKGFYDEKKIELKLSKKFKFYSDTE